MRQSWARFGVFVGTGLLAITPEPKSGSGVIYEALTAARHPIIGVSAMALAGYAAGRLSPEMSRTAKVATGFLAVTGLNLAAEIIQSRYHGFSLMDAQYPLASFENLKDYGAALLGGAAYAATSLINSRISVWAESSELHAETELVDQVY